MTPALGKSLLRLFTVQGSYDYERMQGIGVGVAEEPLLRDLRAAGNGAVYRAAVARGAHFFNAHPYLCGLAVGAALPLAAQYLSGAFTGWSRGALAVVAAGGFALLWWRRGKLTGVRFGLGLLAVAALAGGLWR